MEVRRTNYSLKRIVSDMKKGKITFDFPIQRESGQWDKTQQGLLIHSILQGFIIPDVYIIKEGSTEFSPFSVLDGKQRLTTVYNYYNDKFKLPKDIENVVIIDVDFTNGEQNISENSYIVADKRFSELDGKLKEIFLDFTFDAKMLVGFTDDEIEEQFYRLNNGCIFTKAQKSNVKLGTVLAGKLKEIEQSNFFKYKALFSSAQRRRGEITSCILQTLMLLIGYEYSNFGSSEVFKFAEWYSENYDEKQLEYCKQLFDRLYNLLPKDEMSKKYLKKINIPMQVMNLDYMDSLDESISDKEYTEFLTKWFEVWIETSGYIDFCGQGSTSKTKVEGRLTIIDKELKDYVINKTIERNESNGTIKEETDRFEAAS
jgi:hypothetical protein